MELPIPPPEVATLGLRALVTVARADGEVTQLEREFIDAAQRYILRTQLDVGSLPSIEPEELAAGVADQGFRERIVRGCVLVGLIDAQASEAEVKVIDRFAEGPSTPSCS